MAGQGQLILGNGLAPVLRVGNTRLIHMLARKRPGVARAKGNRNKVKVDAENNK